MAKKEQAMKPVPDFTVKNLLYNFPILNASLKGLCTNTSHVLFIIIVLCVFLHVNATWGNL